MHTLDLKPPAATGSFEIVNHKVPENGLFTFARRYCFTLRHYYLRKKVMFYPPSFCAFVCVQNYVKTTEAIFMKLGVQIDINKGEVEFEFGDI